MNSLARSIIGAAVTAAAVYFLDPANGHERRLLFQDRCKRAVRRLDLGSRDMRHDVAARARFLARRNNGAVSHKSDRSVSKSVRGAIRHSVSHPETIDVAVDHGHVILRGNLLPHEHQRLLDDVRRQPGVMMVTDHLSEHRGNGEYAVDAGRAFKSAAGRSGWGTTGRVLAGCAGGALLYWGVRERKALGEIAAVIAEDVHRVLERNLRERSSDELHSAEQTIDTAAAGVGDAVRTAANKVDEAVDWAESASSDVMEEYAQSRRQHSGLAEATH